MPQPTSDKHMILIVDDVPDNLAVMSDALDEAGYMVLVATDGTGAIERLGYVTPDLILLDAVMPGMDGFATCRRIRALPGGARIPVIFMTGLTETEHVVQGFAVGGNDYVIKPLQPREVIARIEAQLRSASLISLATAASEATAHAVIVLDRVGAPIWQTSKAMSWIGTYFPDFAPRGFSLPPLLQEWVSNHRDAVAQYPDPIVQMQIPGAGVDLRIRFTKGERSGDLLLILEEITCSRPALSSTAHFNLTPREKEVLDWLVKGKTNRDIAEILGMSPRTVNKHLEHIFIKLGVETRSSAVAMAMSYRSVEPNKAF